MSIYRGPSKIGESADNTVAMVLSAINSANTASNAANASSASAVAASISKSAAAASALQLANFEGLLGQDSALAADSRNAAQIAAAQALTRSAAAAVSQYEAKLSEVEVEAVANANKHIYPGAYTTDPLTRPDGSARQEGDSAFINKLERRWNGTTWQASDINTANLAAPGGTSLIGNLQSGAGSVPRTAQGKLREFVSVRDFGGVGNGAANDTIAVQAAVNASLRVYLGTAEDNFRVTAPIVLRTGQVIVGGGARLTQGTANTEILNTEGKSNLDISGVAFVGIGTDYSESDSNRGAAIYGATSGSNIRVHHNTFTNFGYTSARFAGQRNCAFTDNIVVGPGGPLLTYLTSGRNYGVLFDSGCVGAVASRNTISAHAQGMRIEGTSFMRVTENRIFDIVGQHGIYTGSGISQLAISGNVITNTDLCGIKVQTADAALVDNTGITITGNTVDDTGDQGILVCSGNNGSAGTRTRKCRGVTVSDNVVSNALGNGITLDNTIDATVTGNVVRFTGQGGVVWDDCFGVRIADNYLRSCGRTALRDGAASNSITLQHNTVINPATSNVVSDEYGILINAGGTDYVIDGNVITDSGNNMDYGIFIIGNVNATLTLTRNTVIGASSTGLRLISTAALREYRGNNFNGATAATFNDPVLAAAASANNLPLPAVHDVVRITGITRVDNIVANGQSGRRATLVFDDIVRFVHGNNLRLAGSVDFFSTAADTLTLACDGSLWYEVSRSVN